MIREVFTSIEQVQRRFFPNDILDRLTKKIIKEAYPSFISRNIQYRISKDKDNQRMGLIEIAKLNNFIGDISDIVKDFYLEEEFKVEQKDKKGLIVAEKDEEKYWISVSYDINLNVYVGKAIL